MAGGLLALLDDVALIARKAAVSVDDVASIAGKTATRSAGVVIDDAAVTPTFLEGADPKREIPIIWKITKGSLINKILFILPVALLLSAFAPWLLTPLLMMGGTYLCYEGAHKVLGALGIGHHDEHNEDDQAAVEKGPEAEDKMVKGAITTDFILSAEIMVITLNEVIDLSLWMRAAVMFVVAIIITLVVYGAVALLIKLDDIGLGLVNSGKAPGLGRGLVKAMPIVLNIIGVVGTAAMLWVGGHIIIKGASDLGWTWPYETVHHLSTLGGSGFVAWLIDTAVSLVVGLIWGTIVMAIVTPIKKIVKKN